MSRSWCPALLAAEDEVTTFSSQLRAATGGHVAHAPQSQQKRPASPAKLKSLLAAKSSAASEAIGSMTPRHTTAEAADGSPIKSGEGLSRFSSRIAISTFNAKCFADTVLSEAAGGSDAPPVPVVEFVATTPDEFSSTAPLQTKLAVRSVRLLERLQDFASAGADNGSSASFDDAMGNISLARVDMASDEIASAISKLRSTFPLVRGLDLSHTMRGTGGAQALTRVLQGGGNEDPLRSLDISDNPSALAEGAESFGKLLQKLPNLNFLNISGTGAGPSLGTLAPVLQQQSTVISLGLASNAIGAQEDTVISAVASLLQENKFLLQVDLSNNELGAAASKQLLDAIGASDTRAKTPDHDPEPEGEEFTDELPPEEEAPTVTVGFPQEEKQDESAPAKLDAEPASPAAAPAATAEGEQPAAEEAEEGTAAELEVSESQKLQPEATAAPEEVDPEELAAQQAAAEEAKRVAAEEALTAWKEKMTKYIWEPQQILFLFDESKARRAVLSEYAAESIAMKKVEKAEKKDSKQLQLQRERKERERRSGWTHLQSVNLSNNPIGSDGAKALAKMLQHSVPLSAEEQLTSEEEYNRTLAELRDLAVVQRKKALQEKRREAKMLEQQRAREEAERAKEAAQKQKAAEAAEKAPNEEVPDEEAAEAGEGQNEETEATGGDEVAAAGDEEEAGNALDEMEDDIPDDEIDVSDVTAPPPKKNRPGVRTLQSIDVSGCRIGAIGLKAVAAVLKDNCPSLRYLNLANNKFATKKVAVALPRQEDALADAGDEANGDEEEITVKVDQVDFVSPGIAALSEAIASPACALVSLDLSHNKLYPDAIIRLAEGLRNNSGLLYLNLSDNFVGFRTAEVVSSAAPASTAGTPASGAFKALLNAVSRQGQLHTFLLRNNDLHNETAKENWQILFQRCASLKNLDLSTNALTNADIRMMLEAMSEGDGIQQLRYLNLGNNREIVGEVAGFILGNMCVAQKKLKTLVLRSCTGLGDAGLTNLCEGLKNHSSLQNIVLRQTGLTYVEPLGHIMPSISFLRHLDVADNELSSYAGRKLLQDCVNCPSFRTIQIWSRSSSREDELDELVMAATELASAGGRTLQLADLGAPIMFASAPKGIRFTPPSTPPLVGGPGEDDEGVDPVEELEWLCLRNRLIAANSTQS
jgi:hypothetical protein